MSIEIDQLKRLPVSEKLRIVEELWDDIRTSEEPLTLHPDLQQEVLNREMPANGTTLFRSNLEIGSAHM